MKTTILSIIYCLCLLSLVLTAAIQPRSRLATDVWLREFDADGEVKQFRYAQQMIDKSDPVVCFVSKRLKAHIFLAAHRTRSKLTLPNSYQRIHLQYGDNCYAVVGHKPDYDRAAIFLQSLLIDSLQSQGELPTIKFTANKLALWLVQGAFADLEGSNDDDDDDDEEEDAVDNSKNRKQRQARVSRPFATNVVMSNSDLFVQKGTLAFTKVDHTGHIAIGRSFLLGQSNSFLLSRLQRMNEETALERTDSISLDDAMDTLSDHVQDILDCLDEYQYFELAFVRHSSEKSVYISPCSKASLLDQLDNVNL